MSKREIIERLRLKAIDMVSASASPLQTPVAAPVGSQLFQTTGRPWMKRGSTDSAWIQQLIRGTNYFNVKDYGATGDGVTDDRAAINLAKTAAIAAGGGVVFFPPGTYAVQRNGVASSIQLSGTDQKIVFLGCGRSSRVLMSGSAGGGATGWYLFDVTDGATNVAFQNLCLDGSAATNLGIGQDHHTIRVAGLTADATNVWCIDCYWNKTDGDGIRLLGSSLTSVVRDVRVIRGVFQMDVGGGGTGSRAGVTVQRNCTHVSIHSCLMEGSTDQVLDMETSGTGTTGDIQITRSHLLHTAPLSSTVCSCNGGATVTFRRLLFANVIFDGGAIAYHDMSQLTMMQCMQTVSRFASVGGSVNMDGITDSVIYGCQLYREDTDDSVGYSIEYIAGIAGTRNCIVAGSICENASLPAGGQDGILVENGASIGVHDSIVVVAQLNNNVGATVRFRSLTADANFNVCRRSILIGSSGVVGVGVQMAAGTAGRTTNGCEAFGNIMRNVLNGVGLSAVASSSVTNSLGANNVAVTTSQMFATGSPAPVGICVGGNAGLLARGIWEFTATPLSAITAEIGAFGCNRVGAASTTLYVKEADNGLSTGWVAK